MALPADREQPGLRQARRQRVVPAAVARTGARPRRELAPAREADRARQRVQLPVRCRPDAILAVAPEVVEHIADRVPALSWRGEHALVVAVGEHGPATGPPVLARERTMIRARRRDQEALHAARERLVVGAASAMRRTCVRWMLRWTTRNSTCASDVASARRNAWIHAPPPQRAQLGDGAHRDEHRLAPLSAAAAPCGARSPAASASAGPPPRARLRATGRSCPVAGTGTTTARAACARGHEQTLTPRELRQLKIADLFRSRHRSTRASTCGPPLHRPAVGLDARRDPPYAAGSEALRAATSRSEATAAIRPVEVQGCCAESVQQQPRSLIRSRNRAVSR